LIGKNLVSRERERVTFYNRVVASRDVLQRQREQRERDEFLSSAAAAAAAAARKRRWSWVSLSIDGVPDEIHVALRRESRALVRVVHELAGNGPHGA
jgi:hypothetical protein